MLIGSNLKMYFSHERTLAWVDEVSAGVAADPERYAGVTTFVLPQFPSLADAARLAVPRGMVVGAQDVSVETEGAFTGEVSAGVLAELGARFVLVGHAERRDRFGETDSEIAAKVSAVRRAGLIPMLCVGESDQVDAEEAARECRAQIDAALAGPGSQGEGDGEVVVAYEPIWAIGAAEPADPAHIRAVCAELSAHLAARGVDGRVIYGGSARRGLLEQIADSVDGLFLGRFAHDPREFHAILDEAAAIAREQSVARRSAGER